MSRDYFTESKDLLNASICKSIILRIKAVAAISLILGKAPSRVEDLTDSWSNLVTTLVDCHATGNIIVIVEPKFENSKKGQEIRSWCDNNDVKCMKGQG